MSNAAAAFNAAPAAAAPAPVPAAPAPAPAAAAPAAAPAPAPAAAPAPAPAPANWYDGFENAEVKTWTAAKGFKDPSAVAESAYNLEKLVGFDRAGRTLVIPKDDAPPEEVKAFRAKLGVPEAAEGYTLEALKDSPTEFQNTAKGWMHKAGIPSAQANVLAAEFAAFSKEQQAGAERSMVADSDKAFAATNAEWGKEAEAKLEIGKRFCMQVLPEEVALDSGAKVSRQQFLETIFNRTGATGAMLKLFAQAGAGLGEHKMVTNGQAPNVGTSAAEAQAKITSLKSNKEWSAAYLAGDKGKLAEMQGLMQTAYGGR